MKVLVIYYSYDGNSALIAELLKMSANADTLMLEVESEKHHKGFLKYLFGGWQVIRHKKPTLKPFTVNFNDYGIIVMGGPVWAGAPAPALLSFLTKNPLKDKKVALFCCCSGGDADKAMERMKALLEGNVIAGEIVFQNPLNGNKNEIAEKVGAWMKELVK
ncbi:MAG: flavodoxin [Treponema sp.]|jgi:flavodoxin|nr:flavodoxin [Treponema sp.]